ncbi:membrane-associated guanylate kinase, WW and PDZ domain-containing protein 2-like [Dendronephthya gigantea]|uniref:membrane-associated guanylate kinase, WW and PDZ domain-containing protein 2-like n=1 Tax=Dendronephthya gigantea TaxID=151771 RepID=UPI00106A7591|nr:membrane-associated guanylate kinase, WW and PDZ domain-containing protein 2-like [Dendronephthya gigantea]
MPAHASQKSQRHWSKNVRDVSLIHEGLQLRIEGGAENGEFLYVADLPAEKTRYRKGRFRVGDILIELNEEAVVGLTLKDLMNLINKAGRKVNFKVVQPGGGINKDMRDFLCKDFPNTDEVDIDLQDATRDNLYARTVPCTTRQPRSGEEPGIDYVFISREKFIEMERCGHFLETGSYNGHYYGTPKPLLSDLVMVENNATKSRTLEDETQTIEKNIEQVTVHENSDELEEKKESYLKLNKANNSEKNNSKTTEILDKQPINV